MVAIESTDNTQREITWGRPGLTIAPVRFDRHDRDAKGRLIHALIRSTDFEGPPRTVVDRFSVEPRSQWSWRQSAKPGEWERDA
jgi:hypothetical protein